LPTLKRKTSSGYETISEQTPFSIPVEIVESELQEKSITITNNGSSTVTPDSGYDGLSTVNITTNVPQPSGSTSITQNGTYDVTNYASAVVNVSGSSATEPYVEETYSNGNRTAIKLYGYNNKGYGGWNYLQSINWNGATPTKIGLYSFYSCNNLNPLTIPSTVTSIGIGAFYACNSLRSLTIPNSVTIIDSQAFMYCSSLTSLTIGRGVRTIGTYAFYSMASSYSAGTVTFNGTPSSIASNAFGNGTKITDIYVPWSSGAVSGAPWGATNATIHYNS